MAAKKPVPHEILTDDNSQADLEDRITYILSEWLNDNAPLGQAKYRPVAMAVIKIVKEWGKK